MARPFEGCWERIARAEEHVQASARVWNEFIEKQRFDPCVRVEPDGTGGIYVVQNAPLPSILSLELGEMLYQLRGALDGCVYQAAILETGQNPPPNEEALEFPICPSPEAFKRANRKIAPLTGKRREIIEAVQPYNAPALDPEHTVLNFNRALEILNDWARKDRHRKLHVVGAWVSNARPQIRIPQGTDLAYFLVTDETFLERETQIASFRIDGWTPGMVIEGNPDNAIDLAVNEFPTSCADSDTLGNRIRVMIVAVKTIVRGFEDSFELDPR